MILCNLKKKMKWGTDLKEEERTSGDKELKYLIVI